MRPKTSVFIAVSLDGQIARSDGSLDWLDQANKSVPSGEDCGYGTFSQSVDTLVLGRKTFEQVLSFGDWPYTNKRVVILSTRPLIIPEHLPKNVSSSKEQPDELLKRLAREGAQHVYVDGGATIRSFLEADLIDEITLTIIPIILGQGMSLFEKLSKEISLTHVGSKSYDFGYVQLKYIVNK